MKISEKGVNFVVKHEGLRLDLYLDAANYYTIGIGHKCSKQEVSDYTDGISKQQALEIFYNDLIIPAKTINSLDINFYQHQFDALMSLIFNIGSGNFSKSSIKANILTDYNNNVAIDDSFMKYSYAGGKFLQMLSNRRASEANLYINAKY